MKSIELPDRIHVLVARAARAQGVPPEKIVRKAVAEYLADLDDYNTAIARIEKSRKSIPLAAVKKNLGLEG